MADSRSPSNHERPSTDRASGPNTVDGRLADVSVKKLQIWGPGNRLLFTSAERSSETSASQRPPGPQLGLNRASPSVRVRGSKPLPSSRIRSGNLPGGHPLGAAGLLDELPVVRHRLPQDEQRHRRDLVAKAGIGPHDRGRAARVEERRDREDALLAHEAERRPQADRLDQVTAGKCPDGGFIEYMFTGREQSPYVNQLPSDDGQAAMSVAGRNVRYNNVQIDGAVNNDVFGRPYDFLMKREWEWSAKDRALYVGTAKSLDRTPPALARKIFHSIEAPHQMTSIQCGDVEAVPVEEVGAHVSGRERLVPQPACRSAVRGLAFEARSPDPGSAHFFSQALTFAALALTHCSAALPISLAAKHAEHVAHQAVGRPVGHPDPTARAAHPGHLARHGVLVRHARGNFVGGDGMMNRINPVDFNNVYACSQNGSCQRSSTCARSSCTLFPA
mgnify:CR=1 FL=1